MIDIIKSSSPTTTIFILLNLNLDNFPIPNPNFYKLANKIKKFNKLNLIILLILN